MGPEKSSGQLEAEAIIRLSTLEKLRDQARAGNRPAMLGSIERMIESELRLLQKLREAHLPHEAAHAPAQGVPHAPSEHPRAD